MRYECTVPGFESDWVEVKEFWSRKALREWFGVNDDDTVPVEEDADNAGDYAKSDYEYCDRCKDRIIGLHLTTVDGSDPILSPSEITPQAFDERLDAEVSMWLNYVIPASYQRRSSLGEEHGRKLFRHIASEDS